MRLNILNAHARFFKKLNYFCNRVKIESLEQCTLHHSSSTLKGVANDLPKQKPWWQKNRIDHKKYNPNVHFHVTLLSSYRQRPTSGPSYNFIMLQLCICGFFFLPLLLTLPPKISWRQTHLIWLYVSLVLLSFPHVCVGRYCDPFAGRLLAGFHKDWRESHARYDHMPNYPRWHKAWPIVPTLRCVLHRYQTNRRKLVQFAQAPTPKHEGNGMWLLLLKRPAN